MGWLSYVSDCYFNPHPLWRGWQLAILSNVSPLDFNPHPLWRGWLLLYAQIGGFKNIFQSTPSVKRVTLNTVESYTGADISIHTLCEEGDKHTDKTWHIILYFNPHPLWRGWRVKHCWELYGCGYFNPHPLWRGWQFFHTLCHFVIKFQSTPSVKRVTLILYTIHLHTCYFNPHPLWRGWHSRASL